MKNYLLSAKKRRFVAGIITGGLVLVLTLVLYAIDFMPPRIIPARQSRGSISEQSKSLVPFNSPSITQTGSDDNGSEIIVEGLSDGWQRVTNTVYDYSIEVPGEWEVRNQSRDGFGLYLNIDQEKILAAGMRQEHSSVLIGFTSIRTDETLDMYAGEFPSEIFKPSEPVKFFTVNGVHSAMYEFVAPVFQPDGAGLSRRVGIYMFEVEQGIVEMHFEYDPYQLQLLRAKTGEVYVPSVSEENFSRIMQSFALQ